MTKEQTPITAEDYFKLEWGTAFIKATLSERNGLVELSMQDIYSSMEQYAKAKVLEALEPIRKEIKELKRINELMKSDVKLAKSLLEELKQN